MRARLDDAGRTRCRGAAESSQVSGPTELRRSGFLRQTDRGATCWEVENPSVYRQEVLMPGMQPIETDVLTGFRSGDERALEQVFRARFEPLKDQATAALGEDPAAAPKVVEGAFV